MNSTDLRAAVLKVLSEIAPEAANITIDDGEPLREQLDIDSMDFLNFVIGLHRDLHVDIPERDYRQVQTLNDLVDYLAAQLRPPASRS